MTTAALLTIVSLALGAPPIEVVLTRDADKATLRGDERVTIAITSASGIGAARLRPGKEGWPDAVRLELGLKGLEGFSITGGDWRVRTFLGSKMPETLRRRDDKWEPIDADPELTPTIRKQDGRILIDLPPRWLDGKQRELHIEWVDFYRG